MGCSNNDFVFIVIIMCVSYMWFNRKNYGYSSVKNSGTVSVDETSLNGDPVPQAGGGNINLSQFNLAAYKPTDKLPKSSPGTWSADELLPANGAIDFEETNFLISPMQQAGVWVDSTRNANLQYRRDPIIKKFDVGPWSNTTINPDPFRK